MSKKQELIKSFHEQFIAKYGNLYTNLKIEYNVNNFETSTISGKCTIHGVRFKNKMIRFTNTLCPCSTCESDKMKKLMTDVQNEGLKKFYEWCRETKGLTKTKILNEIESRLNPDY